METDVNILKCSSSERSLSSTSSSSRDNCIEAAINTDVTSRALFTRSTENDIEANINKSDTNCPSNESKTYAFQNGFYVETKETSTNTAVMVSSAGNVVTSTYKDLYRVQKPVFRTGE